LKIKCQRPVLIVEGDGDAAAVPRLIRETLHLHQIYDVNAAPRPKKNVELRKLRRSGELERYVEYALRDDGDSVLIVLDCADFDPLEISAEFIERAAKLRRDEKKVGVVLLKSEFETLFLHCLPEIAAHFPEYGWRSDHLKIDGDLEEIRDAKGMISMAMRERAYKPTRDQEKFITPLVFDRLRCKSPSFCRFEKTLLWLAGQKDVDQPFCPLR
jgi:hypothetical protein